MNDETHSPKIMFFGFFTIIIVIIVMVTMYGLSKKNSLFPGSNSSQNIPSVVPTKTIEGSVSLSVDSTVKAIVNGRTFLKVIGNSNGKEVTGFDLLLKYDPLMVEVMQVQSTAQDFQVMSKDGGNILSITGYKMPSAKTKSVFSESEIINIVVRPKKAGPAVFEILAENGKEVTKFVDASTSIFYPATGKITVEIQ